jgi:hypothetical protein
VTTGQQREVLRRESPHLAAGAAEEAREAGRVFIEGDRLAEAVTGVGVAGRSPSAVVGR